MQRALLFVTVLVSGFSRADVPDTIEAIKPSIVAVGSFERTRNPQFSFFGTGFAVGDGSLVATNEHVLPKTLNAQRNETIAIVVRSGKGTDRIRAARRSVSDESVDLALLKFDGPPLPPLQLGTSGNVREGEEYLLTGFPIGAVLGLFPVTHRAMIAAVTPIVIPAARANQLNSQAVRRLSAGPYAIFQLDGTAYPGNSGSPVYHPQSGVVIAIVNSVFVKSSRESALTHPSGVTYAIPAEKLKELLENTR
ncbi:MAG TPA: serine protease [Verrucomicrobiae bacterium]|nr:serine protease [Verrucomicrobiae bacterium]